MPPLTELLEALQTATANLLVATTEDYVESKDKFKDAINALQEWGFIE